VASLAYLDSLAVAKLVALEAETDALETDLVNREGILTSRLTTTEVARAAARAGHRPLLQQVDAVMASFVLLEVTPAILAAAGGLAPAALRTLDALHLATIASLDRDAVDVICYDDRLADAARELGFVVLQPGLAVRETRRPAPRRTARGGRGSGRRRSAAQG
jgi:predicted nucleic acid-binding protein